VLMYAWNTSDCSNGTAPKESREPEQLSGSTGEYGGMSPNGYTRFLVCHSQISAEMHSFLGLKKFYMTKDDIICYARTTALDCGFSTFIQSCGHNYDKMRCVMFNRKHNHNIENWKGKGSTHDA
jgi:hypothetical protein